MVVIRQQKRDRICYSEKYLRTISMKSHQKTNYGKLGIMVTTAITVLSSCSHLCDNPLGQSFRIDPAPNSAGFQSSSARGNAIAFDGFGNSVVAFNSTHSDSMGDPYVERFNAAGISIGGPMLVNPTINQLEYAPAVGMAPTGEFVVAWPANGPDGDDFGIFARVYSSTGHPVGPEFQVNQNTQGAQITHSVTMDDDGNFAIVWTTYDQDNPNNRPISLRTFDADGMPTSNEMEVASRGRTASIAATSTGDLMVVWETQVPNWEIRGRHYDAIGNPLGDAYVLNDSDAFRHTAPYARASRAGGFVVTWESFGTNGKELHARRIPETGGAANPLIVIADYVYTESYPVKLASTKSGELVFVWHDFVEESNPFNIYARLFDAENVPLGETFRVNEDTDGRQWFPSVGVSREGRFTVVWTGIPAGNMSSIVLGRRFGCDSVFPQEKE